jgi:uncharacterized Zn finger protein
MPPYQLLDVQRVIPDAALARAKRYLREGRVRKVEPGDETGTLIGGVQGSEYEPYKQRIQIVGDGRDRRIMGWCSCPVGANFKHRGAL